MKNQEEKIELQKKIYVRDIAFLATHPQSYAIFVAFFVYSFPLPPSYKAVECLAI